MALLSDITTAWSSLVTDEKIRLEKLQLRRDQFKEWDEKVKEVVEEDEKRLSLDVLRDLLKQGTIYPQGKIVHLALMRMYVSCLISRADNNKTDFDCTNPLQIKINQVPRR